MSGHLDMSQPVKPKSKEEPKASAGKHQAKSEAKDGGDVPVTERCQLVAAKQGDCNNCPVCSKTVDDNDMALQCEIC